MADTTALLKEIIDYFATAKQPLGEDWAHDDELTSYCLDYKARDGTQFWIDLNNDGTIHLLWKPLGRGEPIIKIFRVTA